MSEENESAENGENNEEEVQKSVDELFTELSEKEDTINGLLGMLSDARNEREDILLKIRNKIPDNYALITRSNVEHS